MRASRATGWVVGTLFGVLVVFAVTWFLVAGPRFAAADETMLQAENTRSQNEILALQNVQLKSDFAKLEEYRAEVATLRAQMPADAGLAELTREVDRLAEANGVFLLEITPGAGQAFLPAPPPIPATPAPAPAPAEGEGGEVSTESETGTVADVAEGTAPAAPVAPLTPEGMVAVPLGMRVVGGYAETTAFLEALQTQMSRLYLVTKADATRQTDQEATPSRPATTAGDLELSISGFTYVLLDLAPVTPPVEGEEPAPAPLPSSDRNPFVPLG